MRNSTNRSTAHEDAPAETIRLGSAAEFLAAVPYLVGFHPSESLVLVGLAEGRVAVTARLDLEDCGDDDLHHALQILVRAGSDAAMAACFSDTRVESWGFPWAVVVEPLRELAAWMDLPILDVLVVREQRFWIYGEELHEELGRSLADGSSMAAASATYAGLVARPDRASLLAVFDQLPLAERRARQPHLARYEDAGDEAERVGTGERHRRSVKRAVFAAARRADQTLPLPVESDGHLADLCRYAVGLTDIEIRDALWLAIDQRRLDGRSLWQELMVSMPAPYDAAPLFLFGWASWREGHGILAVEAGLRALESSPAYSAAELLLGAVESGLDPFRTPRLRSR